MGRRAYARQFVAGNDGNLSARVGAERVLCTPTMICKGYMTPDDLCIVDLSGTQIEGRRPITSEIRMHLEIYKADAAVRAVVHTHPPHATAFGIAGEEIPTGVLPECELMLGRVPSVAYETPGTQALAEMVGRMSIGASALVLRNHGTVTWSTAVEPAYWLTEVLDSYCRVLLIARELGRVNRLPAEKVQALLELRAKFGQAADPRAGRPAQFFANAGFGAERA